MLTAAISVSGQQATSGLANSDSSGNAGQTAKKAPDGKTCDLIISSDHSEASVELDGKVAAGETPLTIKGISAGEHRIVVRKGPWFGAQKISLAPGDVSRVTIHMQDEKGSLKVFSQPAGAEIVIDGKTIGVTPLKITNVDAGERLMVLRLQGYMAVESGVQITKNETQNISVVLKPSAFISVKARPASAAIVINGGIAGMGEVDRKEVLAGDVTLSIEAPDYEAWKETVSLKQGELHSVDKTLSSLFDTLTVTTVPPGATLFINNQPSGTTPFRSEKLAPGSYRVRLELPGYDPMEGTVVLKPGESHAIEKKMIGIYGSLSVSTTPPGAVVFLNDHHFGTTPYRNDKLQNGVYSLRLELPGYAGIPAENITIGKEAAINRQYTLSRSKAWLDSVDAFKLAKYRHKRWTRRFVFGLLAAGCGGVGAYFNQAAENSYHDYSQLNQTSDFDTKWKDVETNRTTRNILYSVAGGFAALFFISIPF